MDTRCGSQILVAKTCRGCNEVKDATCFLKRKTGFYDSYCDPCRITQIDTLLKKNNDASLEHATKNYELWSHQELADLARMVNKGMPVAEIAKNLGRTIMAVQGKQYNERIYKQTRVYTAKPGAKIDTTYLHNYFQEMAA